MVVAELEGGAHFVGTGVNPWSNCYVRFSHLNESNYEHCLNNSPFNCNYCSGESGVAGTNVLCNISREYALHTRLYVIIYMYLSLA